MTSPRPDGITEQVVALLHAHARPAGLVLDVGCGSAGAADAIVALGLSYAGCDGDAALVAALQDRNHEAHRVDPSEVAGLGKRLLEVAGERAVAAVVVPAALATVGDLDALLHELRAAVADLGDPPLVVSVPNAGLFDLAAALATGRAELPPAGSAGTPERLFTATGLATVMTSAGWAEVERADVLPAAGAATPPTDHPALAAGVPLHDLLWRLRQRAGDDLAVTQFVRLFRPAATPPATVAPDDRPFLTVLVRTQGRRTGNLVEALVCLAAQTDPDLEIVVLVHAPDVEPVARTGDLVASFAPSVARRVRVVQVAGGRRGRPLNEGLRQANGRYVAFLDDDDLVTSDWVERFRAGAAAAPGRVVRSVAVDRRVRRGPDGDASAPYVTIGGLETTHAPRFDALEHFSRNRTPICSFAVPREAVRALGLAFDEEALVLEDWPFFLAIALVSGVHDTGRVTSVYHRWQGSDSAAATVDVGVWEDAHRAVVAGFDAGPLLLPPGSAGRIALMYEKSRILDHEMPAHNVERADLAARLAAAERSAAERQSEHEEAVSILEVALTDAQQVADAACAEAARSRSETDDVLAHADRMAAAADAMRSEVEALKASTTWRIMEPGRRLGGLARRAAAAVSAFARPD